MKIKGRKQSKNISDVREKKRTFQRAAIEMTNSLNHYDDAVRMPSRSAMKIGEKVGLSKMEDIAKENRANLAAKKYGSGKSSRKRKRTGGP